MLVKSLSALAVIAFAAQVSASESMPRQFKMSVRNVFDISRRQAGDGYMASLDACGNGTTCAEACGDGYAECSSKDNDVFCYNYKGGETCCPDETGNSCEAGHYCAADAQAQTWCCSNDLDLDACAKEYQVSGVLTKEVAKSTSTTSSTTSSTSSTSTTSTHTSAHNTTTKAPLTNSSTSCTSTIAASTTFPAANSTTPVVISSPTTSTPAKVTANAANFLVPAGTFAGAVIAGLVALL